MGIFDRSHRFAVWTQVQHPFKHTLSDFAYANPALPGVTNVNSALNYMLAVLYPNTKSNVSTPGDLPTGIDTPNLGDVAPTISDYRVVDDDGDGKSAGYRFEQREGDVTGLWYKIFDVDWSTDAILAAVTDVTNDIYTIQDGKQDLDAAGDIITGLYAGQRLSGGTQANQNLTLNANSGDGVGPQTGFIQVDGAFRPTADNLYDLSTATERWKDAFFSGSNTIGTMLLSSGSITDTSGAIDFDNENLLTTGNINGGVVTGTSLVADDTINTMTLAPGSITDTSGAIDFGASNLSTTGTLGAGVATFSSGVETLTLDANVGGKGSILSTTGTINFGDENLETTGSLTIGALIATLLDVDNVRIDGNTISTTNVNGDLILLPNGTGLVDIQKVLQTLDVFTTGTNTITGILNIDNLRLNGNTLSTTDANGNLILSPNGTGVMNFTSNLIPTSSGSFDLGSSAALMNDIFITGGIRNATNEISIGTLLGFRSSLFRDLAQTQPAQNGDALFYDSVNGVFLASTPDSEVDHTTIANLTTGDAGHTQFAMLAGRATGQILQGGIAASENLVLESTSHATKGNVLLRDNLTPEITAAFAGSWSGIDLGDVTHNYNDVYTKGEFKGFRLENFTSGTLPIFSAQNIGRVVYATDIDKAYVDTGSQMKVLGVSKYATDQAFDGTQLIANVDVSSQIQDARLAQWQLLDNANNFEILYTEITITSASNVRITTLMPLPIGSYRLVGVE